MDLGINLSGSGASGMNMNSSIVSRSKALLSVVVRREKEFVLNVLLIREKYKDEFKAYATVCFINSNYGMICYFC